MVANPAVDATNPTAMRIGLGNSKALVRGKIIKNNPANTNPPDANPPTPALTTSAGSFAPLRT